LYGIIHGSYTESFLEYTLALATASNDTVTSTKIQLEMEKVNFPLQKSTYRSILQECLQVGNGLASYQTLQMMQSKNIPISEWDIQVAISAICKNNRWDPGIGIWKLALDLIYNHGVYLIRDDVNWTTTAIRDDVNSTTTGIKIESYNAIITCMTKDGCWDDVWDILQKMEHRPAVGEENNHTRIHHPPPNLSTYHIILEGLFYSKDGPQSAQRILKSISSIYSPSLDTFDLALSIFLKRENNC